MTQLYTPFMSQAGKTIGDAYTKKTQNKLYSDAYMDKPGAMEQLMQANPAMANQLQQKKQQAQQLKLQQSAKQEAGMKKLFTDNKEIIDQVVEDVAKFDTFEKAKSYFDRKKEEHRPIFGNMLDNVQLTEQMWQESKTVNLEKGKGAGGGIGQVSPKDFTVESIAKYQDTGKIEDLSRYSPKITEIGGVKYQLNSQTQKYEPIVDATSEELTTQAKALADIEADKKSRLDFAESKTKWQTGSPKFKSKIASEKDSQKILQSTADQIKSKVNGWSTKYGASLSGLPGTEARELKGLLNTLKAHSAFSTLTDLKNSGGTLGAISEAELVLLESKLGALDQGGDSAELIRVIDQISISNLASIGRLEAEFANTNKMYSGSFDDFEKSQQSKTSEALPKGVTEEAIEYTMKKRNMTRRQVLDKLGSRK